MVVLFVMRLTSMLKRTQLWYIVPVCSLILTACGMTDVNASAQATAQAQQTATSQTPRVIVADGTIYPDKSSDLRFEISGTVAEVLVQEGQKVEAGEPLARLDPKDLEIQVEQVKASLNEAKAAYAQLEAGATPEEIAAAQARRDQAQAQYTQAQGAVTSSDIAAAEANLRQAREQLAKLDRGADPEVIAIAQAKVDQAQANLNIQRDSLSATKTNAELAMRQATEQLTIAQSTYATALSDWNYVQDTGQHPSNPTVVDPQGNKTKNKVNDTQRQQYYDAMVQSQAAMQAAELTVQQAVVQYDTARQNEVTGIQIAEAQLAEAQANLDNIRAAANADEYATAQARVAQAQAALDKLRGAERAGQLSAAEASVRAAQANLEQASAATRPVDLDVALARIASVEVNLQQAERNLAKATLYAPFSGTIGEINLDLGEQVTSAGGVAVVLADTNTWKIETTNLTERDVVQFSEGSSATITFDAIPDLSIEGTVRTIKPMGTDTYGDITYAVTIKPNTWDDRLRWLMSATVTIQP
jgi:HlyD family secretion protein